MRLNKNFTMGKGKFYFVVKSSPNNITMFRKTKKAAVDAFQRYQRLGKDCEWLGKWDGKKFTEATPPTLPA